MNAVAKLYYTNRRLLKFLRLLTIIAGPGILVMVADNDAGGITTYTATGAKYGYGLIWFLVLLGPMMTARDRSRFHTPLSAEHEVMLVPVAGPIV